MWVIAKVIIKVIVDMITFSNWKDIHEVFMNYSQSEYFVKYSNTNTFKISTKYTNI